MFKYKQAHVVNSEAGTSCRLAHCNESVTVYGGAGQELCRDHQKQLRENGGTARMDRPYTFDKVYECFCCEYNPVTDNKYINEMTERGADEKDIQRAISACIHVDHIDGDHDNNDPLNLQYLCANCHAGKTIANNDHLAHG